MTCVAESFSDHRPLVDRRCHQDVDMSFLDVSHRPLERSHRRLGRLRSRLARFDEHVLRQTVNDVHPLGMHILRRIDYIGVDLLDIVDLLLIESENLR